MYIRVFSSILDSSLMRQEAEARWLFLAMLIIGDESGDGVVDMPLDRLAARAALPEESVRAALAALMAPDPDSHSKEHEGRRLIPLNPEQNERGWIIVNWPRYKELATKEARRAQMRKASSSYRIRLKQLDKIKRREEKARKRHQPSSGVISGNQLVIPTDTDPKAPPASKRKIFIPPTLDEVEAHIKLRGLHVDGESFMSHYASNGWMVGKVPMKNWKAALLTWERNIERGGHR